MKDQLQAGSFSFSRFFQLNRNQTSLLFEKQATFKSQFLGVYFYQVLFSSRGKNHI